MTILISGGCKNGKSSLAQDLACEMAQKIGSRPVYFATMIPHDSEDLERIEKHRADRKNLGFETIECGKNLSETIENMESGRVVLFDSLTALVANELFSEDVMQINTPAGLSQSDDVSVIPNLFRNLSQYSFHITQKIRADLTALIEKSESVIFVSDAIFSEGKIYDETTELYRRILAETENFVAKKSDKVVEMVSGLHEESKNFQFSTFNFQLVLGGAYQGKTSWAKEQFSLSDDDICVCNSDSLPDFSKRCISHYENYVAYCLKHNLAPKTDFSDCANERAGEGKGAKIIISDDIFCGVVPIDAFQRKWREETGLALQKIAKNAAVWRVFCGIATRIQ